MKRQVSPLANGQGTQEVGTLEKFNLLTQNGWEPREKEIDEMVGSGRNWIKKKGSTMTVVETSDNTVVVTRNLFH